MGKYKAGAILWLVLAMTIVMSGVALITEGCTESEKAKNYGGTMTVDLPAGQKLLEATWKEADIWYLCRPMRDGEKAERYEFKEKSRMGVYEGTVVFVEHERKVER